METSAKSGLNVNELFCEIGKRLYKETEKQNKIDKVRKIFFFIYNNLIQKVDPYIKNQAKAITIERKNNKGKKNNCSLC